MINESADTYDTAWDKMYKAIADKTEKYEVKCTKQQINQIKHNTLKQNVQV